MTEKRFTVDENPQGVYAHIKENGDYIGNVYGKYNSYCVANRLNELYDENEQLKDALNQRTEQCDKLYEENQRLKKENKQLRNGFKTWEMR